MPILVAFPAAPADVIRWLLIALGQGSDPGDGTTPPANQWPVYKGGEPSSPDSVITVRDTVGQNDGRSMLDGELNQHYGFQVRVRDTDESSRKAEQIRQAMAGVHLATVTIDGNNYRVWAVTKIGMVLPLGKEKSTKRSLFTLNAQAAIDLL